MPTVIAGSAAMLEVLALARRSAAGDAKVLVTGESGVGKDVIARHIHASSKRARGPFIAVNCAGLTETLLESELFGHVKGSFTGAYRDKRGKLQMAHGGTLFLDEVGEMSLRMQALLLRFLETGEIQSVGAHEETTLVDVRVIAATNRNLPDRVAAGEFREDLLYRLRVIHIHVPPLRERRDDIPLLVQHLLKRADHAVEVSEDAMQLLQRYRWPGNIRELQNVIEQAMWFADREMIDVGHLPPTLRSNDTLLPQRERRRQVADDLYDALVTGGYSFWEHIHPIFLSRDITRHDIRELVVRGLRTTHGNYRGLLRLFGIPTQDYKRFHNFLMAHGCKVDYRSFRQGTPEPARRHKVVLPPLRPGAATSRTGEDPPKDDDATT
ncbi:MAG TPA: sigma 54-interacting transcriptional regulator [Vicinamibacterales bacterium]|nr:sigma 54-interacting transcriptional regulator [Vicinamibacterales bacterium]